MKIPELERMLARMISEVDRKKETTDLTDQDAVYSELTDLFNDVFDRTDIKLSGEMTAKDLPGWDSFKQVELIVAIQDRFRIKLSTREVDALQTVGDLAEAVRRRL